jgi:DNA-binding response OmpR family regulator
LSQNDIFGAGKSRWGEIDVYCDREDFGFDRNIDVHISKLRTKLTSITINYPYIKTVWGIGYMLVTGV